MKLAAEMCSHSATRALVRLPAEDGDNANEVVVRALCKLVKFFHIKLGKPFLYGPGFEHGGIVVLNQKRAFIKLLPQSGKYIIVKNIIECSRRLAQTKKNSHRPKVHNSIWTGVSIYWYPMMLTSGVKV